MTPTGRISRSGAVTCGPPTPDPVEILTAHRADIYVAGWDSSELSQKVVAALDRASVRAIGEPAHVPRDELRLARLMRTCDALLVLPDTGSDVGGVARANAEACGLPIAVVDHADADRPSRVDAGAMPIDDIERGSERWKTYLEAAIDRRPKTTPYAFFIGRLERDFRQARDAIRVAVEDELGMPCLWADDGLHRTGLASVREQTQLLIRQAAVVVADLTLGVENPLHTNPSRAHEIGLATAYERPLVLSSQEPRRVPYFSIGDLQMVFWENEAELLTLMRRRLRAERVHESRTVYNHLLPDQDTRMVRRPRFAYEPSIRYVGPGLSGSLA